MALPPCLMGRDVIAQAKSGTGKTLVFSIAALEHAWKALKATLSRPFDEATSDPRVLIVVPTREVALQIHDVIHLIGAGLLVPPTPAPCIHYPSEAHSGPVGPPCASGRTSRFRTPDRITRAVATARPANSNRTTTGALSIASRPLEAPHGAAPPEEEGEEEGEIVEEQPTASQTPAPSPNPAAPAPSPIPAPLPTSVASPVPAPAPSLAPAPAPAPAPGVLPSQPAVAASPRVAPATPLALRPTQAAPVPMGPAAGESPGAAAQPRLKCEVFIGGTLGQGDRQRLEGCHIVVGTPGRLIHLLRARQLSTRRVRLFILDEADKLLDENLRPQTSRIFEELPLFKQVLAFSATFPPEALRHLEASMASPVFLSLCGGSTCLQGVAQCFHQFPFMPRLAALQRAKVGLLAQILDGCPFDQCAVFCPTQQVDVLAEQLRAGGWPVCGLHGQMEQVARTEALEALRQHRVRVLVATDVAARGVDVPNVNLVVSMDLPHDPETYLHRVGRAGRFHTERAAFEALTTLFEARVAPLPVPLPPPAQSALPGASLRASLPARSHPSSSPGPPSPCGGQDRRLGSPP
ncbi:putative DEAD box polypeptide 20 [Paratrimastix pyriformis]|uniref:RNA helicase n=1 Tax=Paratrimastix pyriformis TaxID=342808 RepID=A0ABQ8UDC7_9EUKA|nr:putative DEAD box polypeptide 20 [Paratrimastix pyriformis]